VLYPDESHHYYPESETWVISWVSFGGYQLRDLLGKMHIKASGVYDVENPERLKENVKQAVTLLTEQTTVSRLESNVLVYSIILDCYYLFHKQGDLLYKESASALTPAMNIIRDEYRRSISLEELASAWNDFYCIPKNIDGDRELIFQVMMEALDLESQMEAVEYGIPSRMKSMDSDMVGAYMPAAMEGIASGAGAYPLTPATPLPDADFFEKPDIDSLHRRPCIPNDRAPE